MPYAQYTLASLRTEIAESLSDSANVYWAADEIERAILEALLVWGALTGYWNERGTFASVASTSTYNLSTQLPSLRTRAYTFGQLVKEIQYALLEPANGVSGTGMTGQFTVGQITAALKRARNEFAVDARMPLTSEQFAVTPGPSGRIALDDSIALISAASWKDERGVYSPLYREDGFSADSAMPLWTAEPGLPVAFSTAETRPVELQLIPPPASSGILDLIFVKTLDLTVSDSIAFAVPDEYAHAIKYRALNVLLSTDAPVYDALRAEYALERYKALVEAAKTMRSVARVQVNDRPVALDTLSNLESGRSSWQNLRGQPDIAACAFDLLFLAPVPDAAYGISLDVTRTAPLPALGSADAIQLGREEISYVADYVRHILSFKLGGDEFVSTMKLHDRFLSGASQRSAFLSKRARYLEPLFSQSAKEEDLEPAA